MIFFPAIDLKDGQCVRLYQGDMERVTVFGEDPAGLDALDGMVEALEEAGDQGGKAVFGYLRRHAVDGVDGARTPEHPGYELA